MRTSKLYKASIFVMAGLLFSVTVVDSADARERKRSGSFVTGKGKSGTFNFTTSGNRKDGITRTKSVTTGNGKTHTRSSTKKYNKETGEFSKTVTGRKGNTRTYTGTAQDGQRSGTYTTSNGKSGTFNNSVQRDGNGTVSRSKSWTNQDGVTKTKSASRTYDKETGEFNKTVTGVKGNTRTYEGVRQDGQTSGTYTTSTGKSGTFEGGKQKNEDGTVTRSRSWTNQDGETKNRSITYGINN